jgi:hypothetical protein
MEITENVLIGDWMQSSLSSIAAFDVVAIESSGEDTLGRRSATAC